MSRLVQRASDRADGWESALLGIGTTDDKLASLRYAGYTTRLTDPVLEAMFVGEIYAYRGVVIYPKVAFSRGVEIAGVKKPAEAAKYLLDDWKLSETCTAGAIWGRLYGGGATWFVTTRNADELTTPLEPGEEVVALRTIERPYLQPLGDVDTFDVHGQPTLYSVNLPSGKSFVVHASRLVLWPGDDTPERVRVQLGYWDASVLQRPYDVLRRNGHTSIASEQLLSEASLGVLKVKELWTAVTSGAQTALATRIRHFNMSRNQSRALILDADKEDFDRVNTTFAGVADLTDRAKQEVAAAFGIPVTRLMGQSPAGLNATGAPDERNFQSDVGAYQMFTLTKRVARIAEVLLESPGSPCSSEGLAIGWPDLWAPTAAEAAQIYATISGADANLMDREVLTAEQVKSRFRPEGYSHELDVNATADEDGDGDLDLNDAEGDDENAPPKPGEAAAVEGEEGATPPAYGSTSTPQGEGGIQSQVFNGTQVSSLIETITSVHAGEIPRESGVEIIMLAYQVDRERAEALLGPEDFEQTKPDPPAFGGGGFGKKPPFGKPPGAGGNTPPAPAGDVGKEPT